MADDTLYKLIFIIIYIIFIFNYYYYNLYDLILANIFNSSIKKLKMLNIKL
ncbi:hypothetical protein BCR32DRAFT_94658 [Anaeromyces robustus]|uniref:Uncharacterized protein n=1 Tax=Anaeromyces robustus TaxID=1754192 RepID=A0A1Y1WPC0_9FUNG|nr:hypothetical protein BCR32DRAFT_94658 [Anaeromyces robustus]|eukprot:ORX75373.1 hypothetical protein BCR32DRAFT_94658 [Anaeromyces robustus]